MDGNGALQQPTATVPDGSVSGTLRGASPREQLLRNMTGDGSTGEGFLSQLSGNPFFTAGFGLAAIGTALSISRKAVTLGGVALRRRMLVDVEITHKDESYDWFLRWMSHYQRTPPSSSASLFDRLATRLTRTHHLSMQTISTKLQSGVADTRFHLVPGPGKHFVYYRSAFLYISRERTERGALDSSGRPFETVKLTTLYRDRHIFSDLFKDAHDLAQEASEGRTSIYTGNRMDWEPIGTPRRKRPLSSVVLARGVKERIVADIHGFIASRNWYLDRGIPYRRGYLLYGPPGTGKSSFIQALAGELDFSIAMLALSQRGLTDDRLNMLLEKVPPRTIVLLEDVDAAFNNRRQADTDGYTGATVTFSGLLNALDGVASAEERIVFLTTNHVDRLDEALIRPGRVDMTVRLGEATSYQAELLWERFYGDKDPQGNLKDMFIQKLKELDALDRISTAALQGLFVYFKEDPRAAIENASGLLPSDDMKEANPEQWNKQ